MPTNPIYPVVSDLLPLEKIPSELEGLREALENVLGELYFKDFRVGQSYHGEAAYYAMTLVTFNPLGLDIPFVQDLKLVVNPDSQGNTEIPISLDYSWEVLKYLNGFNFSSFDNGVGSIVDVLMQLAGITKTEVLNEVLSSFFTGADVLQDFVNAFNTDQGSTIFVDTNVPPGLQLTDVVNQIEKADLDMISFVVNQYLTGANFSESLENLNAVFARWFGTITSNSLNEILQVKFRVLIPNLALGLQFPRKWLVPVDAQLEPLPEPEVSILSFNVGSLIYSSAAGFEFQEAQSFSLTQSMIGNTGLIIEFTNLKVDLEEGQNIPEADAYGRGPGFKGVYAQTAAITLPKKWFDNNENNPNTTARLAGYDILVGTGGFSGRLALEVIDGTSDPLLVKTVGTNGFEVGFSAFDITFDRNKVVSSSIAGRLKIPKLKDELGNDTEIDILGHLDSDGDFLITASEQDGFAPIEIPEVLKLYIQGVELGSEDGNFFIGTTTELEFTNPVMNKLLCNNAGGENIRIALPAVRIYSNGNFEVVGGVIPLPTNFGICLGPAKMSITNLNFSSHQQEYNGVLREYKCWGFDGALNLNPLGVEVRGDGVRYYYTVDDDAANGRPHHSYIRISTIEVDIIIPGNASPSTATAIINGYLSIPEPGVSTEYAGGISVKLPKLGISGSAEMRLQPSYPAFVVDANVEIPVPIPLGATGLGVFGFRGLLGYRYVAEKEAIGLTSGENSWYDYYSYPKRGINIDKFSGPEQTTNYKNPVSIGAGASLASYGNDKIINFRVFMLLSIPSLFFIEGKAGILTKRLELDDVDEPPFFAFLAIGDNSIEAGLGADFKIPKNNGWILNMRADVEAGFFFKNPSAWYINFGTRKEPISARMLTLFTAQTYLQLSGRGIEAGAKAEFEFDKKYGPVRVRAYAYIEIGGFISFERPQLGGYLAAGGEAKIDIKILKVEIGLDLVFGVEAAKPFLIYGKFRICVKIRVVFVKIRFCGKVELKWEKSRVVDRSPLPPITQDRLLELAKGIHMLTGDTFDLVQLNTNITDPDYIPSANNNKFNNTVLPLDTYIDIKFEKAINPNPVAAKTGGVNSAPGNFIELIPPQKIVRGKEVRQVKHEYSMEDIEIKAWNGSSWEDYNPYAALAQDASDLDAQTIASLKLGHWQKTGREYNALRILGDNPFSYTQLGEPGWFTPERLGVTAASLFCKTPVLVPECANWLKKSLDTSYVAYVTDNNSIGNVENLYTTGRMAFWVKAPFFVEALADTYNATVVNKTNSFEYPQSLKIYNFMSLELRFPNPSSQLTFKLSSTAEGVTFFMYRSVINDISLEAGYELVESIYKTRVQLAQEIVYENADQAVSRVIIQPDFPNTEQINILNEDLEGYYDKAFSDFLDTSGGELVLEDLLDINQIEAKKQEIINLIQAGCAGHEAGITLTGGIGQMKIGTNFCVGARDIILEYLTDFKECTTLLHEVCWLSEKDYAFNKNIPGKDAIESDFELATAAQSQVIAPIWRPDTKYYIHLKLKDTVDNNNNTNITGEYHYYYGFRTVGPLGHYHNAPGVNYGGERSGGQLVAPDQYPLTNLKNYIDYNRSYPNADGNLLGSKPLFYSNAEARLQLFFVRPQTYYMFTTWPAFSTGFSEIISDMKIFIKDPANNTLIPYPLPINWDETLLPGGVEEWVNDQQPLEPQYLNLWNNLKVKHHESQLIQPDTSCVITGGNRILPKTKVRSIQLTNLKPQKLYTALVNNYYNGITVEVHNYGFQTSRYANFSEQVNSYLLDDGNGNQQAAIFKISLDTSTATIDTAYSLIQKNPDTIAQGLENRYLDYFDRTIEGVLGIKPLPPAVSTEFNAIADQNTGDTIALLIRNPEPFNDPKIPENEIENTIQILNNVNDEPDGNYKVLHSKDYAQVLIMRSNKKITNPELRIRFRYLLWDGNAYSQQSEVLLENLNINS
jgi:hypothetical protein